MTRNDHSGYRAQRHSRTGRLSQRTSKYLILVTDGRETEINYINGLRQSRAESHIGIRIKQENTQANLVRECLRLGEEYAYREPELWIVLDRDNVPDFDRIIAEAEENGIHAAWSNPCIEIWFMAYFENIVSYTQSKECIAEFKNVFFRNTGNSYRKNDEEIYRRLSESGDERKAIERAENIMRRHRENAIIRPSAMVPGTTMAKLIKTMDDESE